MKKEFKFTYTQFNSFDELTKEQQTLISAADEAKNLAYVPYSHFQVGAALLLEDGTIIKGCNQENKSYPVGVCAERAALFAYGNLERKAPIKILAIVGNGNLISSKEIFSPCGACRQAMAEYTDRQNTPFQILLRNFDGSFNCFDSVHQLLPFIFGNT